jgi:hypothetical protein
MRAGDHLNQTMPVKTEELSMMVKEPLLEEKNKNDKLEMHQLDASPN